MSTIPILDSTADTILAAAVVAKRVDPRLLAALGREERSAWATKLARQMFPTTMDFAPPETVYQPPEVSLLDEHLGDQDERAARIAINEFRKARARGHAGHLRGVPRDLVAKLAPDLAPGPDPWGNLPGAGTGSRIGEEPR